MKSSKRLLWTVVLCAILVSGLSACERAYAPVDESTQPEVVVIEAIDDYLANSVEEDPVNPSAVYELPDQSVVYVWNVAVHVCGSIDPDAHCFTFLEADEDFTAEVIGDNLKVTWHDTHTLWVYSDLTAQYEGSRGSPDGFTSVYRPESMQ